MSRERWGTFSVRDHLVPRAFVVDVLLYDRLVIPYPPTAGERAKWTAQLWNPDELEAKLDIMGPLAIRVPWDEWKRDRFQTRFDAAKDVNFDGKNVIEERGKVDAFHMTRMILAQDFLPELPREVTKVWALAAYPSFGAYQEDMNFASPEEKREKLAMVLTHRFLAPDDPRKSDQEMLKQAVELAERDDFKEKRAKFHRWQEDIVEQEIPADKAVGEMEEYLRQYNEVVTKASRETWWKFGFIAIPVALSIATAGLGAPLVVAGASGLFSVATFAKFDRKPKIDAGDCEAAAMIHDIQEDFDWK